jgi:hypothetical protein
MDASAVVILYSVLAWAGHLADQVAENEPSEDQRRFSAVDNRRHERLHEHVTRQSSK